MDCERFNGINFINFPEVTSISVQLWSVPDFLTALPLLDFTIEAGNQPGSSGSITFASVDFLGNDNFTSCN